MPKNIFEILRSATTKLEATGIESARLDAEVLLAHILNCKRLYLYVDAAKNLSPAQVIHYENLIERRAEKIPVAYLTGQREFMGLNFAVTPDVLIPRPDTEILTQLAIENLSAVENPTFADLGTGSGAICVSILKYVKNAKAAAVDISQDAINCAKFNAEKFGVDDRINFYVGNLFEPLRGQKFHAIISNPPYIPTKDLSTLQDEVKREPKFALDGGVDGLDFYRRIVEDAPNFLFNGGFLAVEIGINQAVDVKNLFAENFTDIEIFRDLAGIERVVAGIYEN
ncbi:MAG: peptide chain release factor N(5)-glutamine methyltransferase [Selenomonadaceae bacterium]|nr:peptide chain release factor N(5)-glutamine methyltransferase [Selenomonadaceae bacterium]